MLHPVALPSPHTLYDGRKLSAFQGPCQTKRLASARQVGMLSGETYPLLVVKALLEEVRRLPDVICILDCLLKQPCPAGPVQCLQVDKFHNAVPGLYIAAYTATAGMPEGLHLVV